MTWKRTGVSLATLLPGTSREVLVDGASVVLARVGPLVFAVEGVCPHMGGLLGQGPLAGRRLSCPEHTAVFDVGTGEVLADPFGVEPPHGTIGPLATYATRVVGGMVEIDVP